MTQATIGRDARPPTQPVPCVVARLHSGVGNWLYIAVEVALVALATNTLLALPPRSTPLFDYRAALRAHPMRAARSGTCRPPRMTPRCASARGAPRAPRALRRRARLPSADCSRATTLASTRALQNSCPPAHGRGRALRNLPRHARMHPCVCLPRESLLCVVRHAEPPVLVLSDSEHASAQLVAVLRLAGVSAVHDEDALGLSASDHSAHSPSAARRALQLWTAFALARRRFASGVSRFLRARCSHGRGGMDKTGSWTRAVSKNTQQTDPGSTVASRAPTKTSSELMRARPPRARLRDTPDDDLQRLLDDLRLRHGPRLADLAA